MSRTVYVGGEVALVDAAAVAVLAIGSPGDDPAAVGQAATNGKTLPVNLMTKSGFPGNSG
jgi:hypothetical protein